LAKWDADKIAAVKADMAEIREAVDKLQEINKFQAQVIDQQVTEWRRISDENEALREQLRQAQQALRNARDAALEEAAARLSWSSCSSCGAVFDPINSPHEDEQCPERYASWDIPEREQIAASIRSLKSTTQGSR
jgi:chromosome segregation ATPase